jgi:2-oxoisovalerate dehydrogenase E1 component
MLEHQEIVLAGEDVGKKGGVYGVTTKLQSRFGSHRVVDTLLDEQSILGLAIGLAHNGILPIAEIQFLAYLHNAEDQLRGEAATLSFFSKGQYANPMVIRVAGLGYQKGFGGHFHNDNSTAVLRDIPGVVVACPSNGADAVLMLRECLRLAREEQRVVVFLEPIALYMTRDLHGEKDGLWTFPYPEPGGGKAIRLGELGQHGEGKELAILSYGNGYYLSRQAGEILQKTHGLAPRILDLRWLSPLDEARVLEATAPCRHVLIVDECRTSGSQSEALMALLAERGPPGQKIQRIAAEDSFIPLGRAATVTLPSRDAIIDAALALTGKRKAAE